MKEAAFNGLIEEHMHDEFWFLISICYTTTTDGRVTNELDGKMR